MPTEPTHLFFAENAARNSTPTLPAPDREHKEDEESSFLGCRVISTIVVVVVVVVVVHNSR